jgi:hypothetical protein
MHAGASPRVGALRELTDRYRLTRFRTLSHSAVSLLPPVWRERVAERFLRHANAPTSRSADYEEAAASADAFETDTYTNAMMIASTARESPG